MATVKDIVIDIKVQSSQAKKEMDKTKEDIKKKAQDIDKSVEQSTKKTTDTVKKGAGQVSDDVKKSTNETSETVKKGNNEVGKSTSETTKKIGNDVKGASDSVNTMGKSIQGGMGKVGTALQTTGNRITQFGKKIKSALRTDAAMAFAAVGAVATSFAKQCIDSAIKAESEWTRFGALVNSNGGNWTQQETSVKNWARTFSNNMGYAVSDTREASMNLLQYGLSMDQVQQGMKGVAGLAARAGISEAEASNVIISALAGRGTQLKKLTGLKIDDYKTDGKRVDTMKLLTDLYRQNEEALSKHAETTEAQMARVDNSWSRLKTTIGTSLMPVVKLVADVLWAVAEAFDKLPDPIKTAISAFLLIGGIITTVIGIAGMLAPGIIAIGEAVGGVAGVFAFLTGPVGIAIAAIVLFVGTMYYLYNTNETVRNALNGLGQWLMGTFAGIWSALAPVLQGVWNWFVELAQSVGSMLIPRLTEIQSTIQPVITVFQHLFQALQRLWTALTGGDVSGASQGFNILAAAGDVLKFVITALIDVGMRLINGVLSIITGVIVVVVGAFTLLVDVVTLVASALQNAGSFFSWLSNQFNAFVSAIMSKAQSVIDIFTSIFDALSGNVDPSVAFQKIVDSIRNIISGSLVEIIVQEMSNIVSAFSDPGAIMGAISSTFTAVVDWFKSVLGIASPGHMARAIEEEMGHIADFIMNAAGTIIGAITSLAQGIWDGFMSALGGLGDWLGQTLGNLPQLIMDGLSNLGNLAVDGGGLQAGIMAMFAPLPTLIMGILNQLAPGVIPAIQSFVMQVIGAFGDIGNSILQLFMNIPTLIGQFFMNLPVMIMQFLMNAVMTVTMYITMIRNAIIMRFNMLILQVSMIWSFIVMAIRMRLMQAWMLAGNLANLIRNAIITRFNMITARVRAIFQNVVSTIRSRLANAVSQAKAKAREIYDGIKAKVSQIPQMVADEFNKIKDKVVNALNNVKSAAVSKISELVAAVKGALGIASPGFIQRMFMYEFTSIPQIIDNESLTAIKGARNMATGIVDAWTNSFGDGLSVPFEDLREQVVSARIVPNMMSTDLNSMMNTGLLTDNIGRAVNTNTTNLQRNTVVHEGDSKTIVIEHFENKMELAKLSKQESRTLLYNALDGLYNGGV